MILNKNAFFKITVIILISISFFLGYFLRENSAGGGTEFYKLSWPIIQSLKKDFLYTINNYSLFGDGTIPFSHTINAYLNPFSNNVSNFQLSVTIISFVIFIIFAVILKKTFSKTNTLDIFLISSVFLVLPFYRTSAFWGKNENYGWLFLILAIYFFSEVGKNISKNPNKRDILNLIFFCLTSACALYARQALIFLPISYLLYLFYNKANKQIIITSIILYFILAIPGILLILIWGDIYDTSNLPAGSVYGGWIDHKYILKNIPILLSFFGFYLLPILIIEFFNSKFKNFLNQYFKSFIFALAIFIFLSQMNLLNYLGNYEKAGGAILKINYLIQKENFFLLLVFSSLGFSILIRFFKENINNFVTIIPMFILFCFPNLLYQEYVEPLIIIMFFLLIRTDLHQVYFKRISFSNFIFLSYFVIFLLGSIYFKHFAFDSFEKWKNFLGG
ncbi:MAG TPA: hypothetical protein QF874_00240 [Pelagibacteraceae bacterium]|jgi:hypothetical protein|nr:hypothetical protein [Pelagibacteraceae bacterium]